MAPTDDSLEHGLQNTSWRIRTFIAELEGPSSIFRQVEIVATATTRAEWQAQFWRLFPSLPDSFIQLARGSLSIHVTVDVADTAPSVKSEYGGYSAAKLSRIIDSSPPDQPRSAQLERAIAAYEKDFAANEAARKRIFLETLDRLPSPPPGFYWASDDGGTLMPNSATFRLWSHDFGFMPGSE